MGENLSDTELHEMIAEANKKHDGKVDFQEFFRVMSKNCNDPLNEFDSDDDQPTKWFYLNFFTKQIIWIHSLQT